MPELRPLHRAAAATLAGLVLALAGAAAHAGAPAQVVEALHAALARNMDNGKALGYPGRLEAITPVVAGAFDFDAIARVALGSAHGDLDAAGQARFRGLMQRLSAVTYADRFDSRGNEERFVTVSEQPVRGGRMLVRTRLERASGSPVALDYLLHETAGGWRIVNVLADGVSDLSLKRAEYASVIRTSGVGGLLTRIEEQVGELDRKAASGG